MRGFGSSGRKSGVSMTNQQFLIAIASGIAGVATTAWLKTKWTRWVPTSVGTKDKNQLLREHGSRIRVAHYLSIAGCFAGALPYFAGWLNDHDLRGLGLPFGLACFLPLAYFTFSNAKGGSDAIKENLIAYAIAYKSPPRILFPLMAIGCIGGIVSAAAFLV